MFKKGSALKNKLLSILLSFLMIVTMFPVSINAQDFDNNTNDTNNTDQQQEYYDQHDDNYDNQDIIEPDLLEEEERKPRALMKAPFKANNNVDELEIRTFIVQFFYGATLNENNDYVWSAPSSTPGHRFSYRINYAISGKFELEPNSIEMRIPKHILKDREDNYADTYEMSIPTKKEVDDGEQIDMDINYAYYEDGDYIVIYNFREVYTGENGYIELSYFTSKSTYNYYDYDKDDSTDKDKSKDFYATIKVTGNGKTVTDESEHFNVYIDTNATIQSVDKRFPSLVRTWNNSWGDKPADADQYYYLEWEIRTLIKEATQPYNFTLEDFDLFDGEIYGLKTSGQEQYTVVLNNPSKTLTSLDQKISSYRHDFVLTRHPIIWWEAQGDHVEVTNNVKATVDPIDQVDPDTTENSRRTFVWNRPQFIHPSGWYDSFKRADRSYDSGDGLDYLGMKADEYSLYNLEDLQKGSVTSLGNIDYAVWFEGYPYIHTIDGDLTTAGPADYWKVPVKFELYDYIFYLYDEADGIDEPNVGTDDETYGIPKQEYIDNRLTYQDFQIDTLAFGTNKYQDAYFNENNQEFSPKSVEYKAEQGYGVTSDILEFYALFGANNNPETDWVLVAKYNLEEQETWFDSTYVSGMNNKTIFFKDNCVGYKVITYNKHYHARIDLVPNIRLKNSNRVMEFINEHQLDGVDAIGILNSETANWYPYNSQTNSFDSKFLTRSESASDYLRRSVRNSHISKRITATSNVVRRKRYNINWEISMEEIYTFGLNEKDYITQNSGIFYDYLPSGSILNNNSVAIINESGYIEDSDFSFETIDNYNDSGQTLLIVHINVPGKNYKLYYETAHPWDSIKDWGNNIYNPVAYETGNKTLSPFNSEGERESDPDTIRDQFNSIVNDSNFDKFIYADTNYDISILTAAAANLHKKVKDSKDEDYSYDTWTNINGDYSYRWRYQNTFNTKAKDLVFFDTMENYPVYDEETDTTKTSDWRGTFKSIDVTQLKAKGIEPIVYYSTIENLDVDIDENHDLNNGQVWKLYNDSIDKTTIKALAVDARKDSNGDDFILQEGDSISVIVYMKAPENGVGISSNNKYPESYNNIYLENTTIDENGGSAHFYIHQDYTTIRLIISSDLRILKVNEENQDEVIPNIKFRLFGTSDYGTDIDLIKTTGKNGTLLFKDIEMGEYILQEYEATDDWLEDHTEYHIKIDKNGDLFINNEKWDALKYFKITNKPRIHGDLLINKLREGTSPEESALIDEINSKNIGNTIEIDGKNYKIVKNDGKKAELQLILEGNAYSVYDANTKTLTFFRSNEDITEGSYYKYDIPNNKIYYNMYEVPGPNPSDVHFAYDHSTFESVYLDNRTNEEAETIVFEDIFRPTDINYLFAGFKNLKQIINQENLDFSEAGTHALVLYGNANTFMNTNLEPWDFSKLNTSNISDMHGWFSSCNVEGIDFSGLDTSNVTNMSNMFSRVHGTSLDITSFDTSNVTNFYDMFGYVYVKRIYVSDKWNMDKLDISAGYYNSMFYGSNSLEKWSFEYDYSKGHYGKDGYLSYKPDYNYRIPYTNNLVIPLEKKPRTPISSTTFKLSGVSDYGNDVLMVLSTGTDGRITFKNIEKGKYELREIDPNSNYVLNNTVWTVIVDEIGNTTILEPEDANLKDRLYQVEKNGLTYNLFNEPRYWGFTLRKIDIVNKQWLQGATFTLTGISDLGTEYNEEAVSDKNGRVLFNRIEKGTYILQEIAAPTGVKEDGTLGGDLNYIPDPIKHIVKIDYKGDVYIDGLSLNEFGDYEVKNDRSYGGKITVIKKWDDGKTGSEATNRPAPVVHLTSYDPETLRYSVIYDANGGVFDDVTRNSLIYQPYKKMAIGDEILSETLIEGQYLVPTKNNCTFDGWYFDQQCTIPFDNTYYGSPTIVYAKWEPTVAYAVYDDSDKSLTFFRDVQGKYTDYQREGSKEYYTNIETRNYDIDGAPWYEKRMHIKSVVFEETITPSSTAYWFAGITIDYLDLSKINTTELISTCNMFGGSDIKSINYGDTFDTSKVTDMSYMFTNSSTLFDFNKLDTSNVTKMYGMFRDHKADEIDLSGFDTHSLTNASFMFQSAKAHTIYVSDKWDTSSIVNSDGMFSMCTNIPGYDSSITDVRAAHYGDGGYLTFKASPTISLTTNSNYIFEDEPDKSIFEKLGLVNRVHAEDENVVFEGVYYDITYKIIKNSDGNYDFYVGNPNATEVITNNMLNQMDPKVLWKQYNPYTESISSITFVGNIELPSNCTLLFGQVGRYMEEDFKISGLEKLDTSKVVNAFQMFLSCGRASKTFVLEGLENWDVSKIQNADSMFQGAGSSAETFSLDLSNWNLSSCTTIERMFYGTASNAKSVYLNLNNWSLPNCTNAEEMFNEFAYSYSLRDGSLVINANNWYLPNCTTIEKMFYRVGEYAKSTTINAKNWNLSKCTNAKNVFENCAYYSKNVDIDLSGWNLSSVTDVSKMFLNTAHNSTSSKLDISKWRLNTKDGGGIYGYDLFNGARFDQFIGFTDWDTRKFNSMGQMFKDFGIGVENLTLDLSFMDALKSTGFSEMFYNSPIKKIVFNRTINGHITQNYFPQMYFGLPANNNDWVRVRDEYGDLTFDDTTYSAHEMATRSNDDLYIPGTWIRKSSPLYNKEFENVEYISEQGVNKNNHWYKIADDTWVYTFDVFSDSIKYYVWEEFMEGYSSKDMYPSFTLFNENGEKNYTITNKAPKDSGKLEISKTVVGKETDIKFDFIITLTGDDISGTQVFDGVVFNDGVARIKLGHNETKTIEDIPWNTTYKVEELPINNFEISNKQGDTERIYKEGDNRHNGSAIFENTYVPPTIEMVDLSIKKSVIGNISNDNEYTIEVLFSNLQANTTYELSNGNSFTSYATGDYPLQIKLKNNQTVTIKDIPVGTTYQVSEIAGDYISSYVITDKNGKNKILKSAGANTSSNKQLLTEIETADEGEDVLVTFTNEINKYQNLSLKKKVTASSTDKEFEFSIELFNLKPNTRYDTSLGRLVSDGDGYIQRDIILKNNDVVTFNDLPVGSSYSIKEKDYSKEGFNPKISSNNDNDTINGLIISGDITKDINTEVEYDNIEKTVLKGEKKWVDDNLLHNNSQEVKLVLKRKSDTTVEEIVDESEYDLKWENNKFYFTNLERLDSSGNEYIYSVEENPVDNYQTSIEYDANEDKYIITNTKDKAKLTIYKKVEGSGADLDKKFSFTITLTNSQGKPVSGVFSDVEFIDGVAVVKLAHNESKTIELYKDISYTIHEDNEEYEVNINDVSDTLKDDHHEHHFINTLESDEYYGSLMIKKIVLADEIDLDKKFNFTIELSDNTISGLYGDIDFVDGIASIQLGHNEYLTAIDLPVGITYKVIEDDYTSEKYHSYYEYSEGNIIVNKTIICTYTNVYEKDKPPYKPPRTGN